MRAEGPKANLHPIPFAPLHVQVRRSRHKRGTNLARVSTVASLQGWSSEATGSRRKAVCSVNRGEKVPGLWATPTAVSQAPCGCSGSSRRIMPFCPPKAGENPPNANLRFPLLPRRSYHRDLHAAVVELMDAPNGILNQDSIVEKLPSQHRESKDARVMELADIGDLKSPGRKVVRVRTPPRAP